MRLTEEAIAALKAMEDERGRLTPEQVVEQARDKSSALHGCFEWDNSVAAEKWRIEQARELLKRVKIEVTVEERIIKTVRYVHNPDMEASDAGYINILKVRSVGAADLLRAELGCISADMERAAGLAHAKAAALPGLAEKIETLKASVDRLAESL